jgi:hypothetical protein
LFSQVTCFGETVDVSLCVYRLQIIGIKDKWEIVGTGVENSNCLDDAFIYLYNIEHWAYTLMFYMYIYIWIFSYYIHVRSLS